MCKTKMNTRVKEPIQISRTSRRTKSYETTRSTTKTSSSSSDPSSTSFAYTTTTTSSSYKDSSKSSISSKTSLKSLRNSLPENAHIYDFSEIRSATKNFLSRRFSSSSSSSSAWKCLIRGKDVIVFQRKFRRLIEMCRLQFSLSIICKSHHSSLIKLLGVSISGDYIYLVYEFVNGGNLRDCLRNPRNPDFTVLSSWISRMQIATDLAQGLEYVHYYTGLNPSPVHNHIKSTSVLVTEPSFKAKLCHFGTSELCGEIIIKQDHYTQNEEDRHNQNGEIQLVEENSTKKLRRSKSKNMKFSGTKGYMSPEYQITGIPTQKSDVYAFGVVILELLSGEEPLKLKIDQGGGDYKSISLIETAKEVIESNNKIRRWIDRRLNDSFPVEIAEKMTRVAIECVDFDPDKRPAMKQVACIFSKLYLQSKKWTDQMGNKIDLTVSLAPR